jgi:hypothetical protein
MLDPLSAQDSLLLEFDREPVVEALYQAPVPESKVSVKITAAWADDAARERLKNSVGSLVGFMGFGETGWNDRPSQLGSDLGIVAEHGIFRYRSNEGYFPMGVPIRAG